MSESNVHHLEVRVVALESQVGRIVSDIESEKDTRSRVHEHIFQEVKEIERRVRSLEKSVYIAFGGFAVLQIMLHLWKK